MLRWILFCWFLLLIACGKHTSESFGFTNNSNTKQGSQANSPEELLMKAIAEGDETLFSKTLTEENLNLRLRDGRTPLIQSVISDKPQFVLTLVQKGADILLVDQLQKTALDYARELGRTRIELLLDANKSLQLEMEFLSLVLKGATSGVKTALENGVNPNFLNADGETPLTLALKQFVSENKPSFILVAIAIAEWSDEAFKLTATDIHLANALGETPFFLVQRLEVTKAPDKKNKQKLIDILVAKGAKE
jgi:hypothetical protein